MLLHSTTIIPRKKARDFFVILNNKRNPQKTSQLRFLIIKELIIPVWYLSRTFRSLSRWCILKMAWRPRQGQMWSLECIYSGTLLLVLHLEHDSKDQLNVKLGQHDPTVLVANPKSLRHHLNISVSNQRTQLNVKNKTSKVEDDELAASAPAVHFSRSNEILYRNIRKHDKKSALDDDWAWPNNSVNHHEQRHRKFHLLSYIHFYSNQRQWHDI